METKNSAVIKCRGVICHEDKIFVVRHNKNAGFYAFPGGHLEGTESPKECIERELFEELGVKPEVGKLLYINSFISENSKIYYIEFFFEIENGVDYLDISKLKGTHSAELFDILWIEKGNDMNILPKKIHQDFDEGVLLKGDVQFID